MEGEASWINHCLDDRRRDIGDFGSFSEIREEVNKEVATVSVDLILPNDLLERILAYLPIASILRAGSVCKRWHEIVSSKRFLWNKSHVLSQKPWYFMFTSSDEPVGYAYDPIFRKWYSIELPCINTSNWFITSSSGLVCFMHSDSRSELYVCNPITKRCKRLEEPPGLKFSDYSALAISVNRISHHYTISIVKSKQVPGNFFQWDLSIHIYDSETMIWVTALTEVVTGWRAGDESVICDGVLYFLIYSTGGGAPENRHGLIMYNLLSRSSHGLLIRSFIPVPCPLTCGRLMNLKGKLVMVGGIGKHDRPDIIKGIGIWVLNGKEWQEVARMPHKFFQGFGEFDDVFASSGTDDLIYIQSYGAPHLLGFDINLKQWKWSQKCPVVKRFPLQLFTGFCFEPRLEIAPFGGFFSAQCSKLKTQIPKLLKGPFPVSLCISSSIFGSQETIAEPHGSGQAQARMFSPRRVSLRPKPKIKPKPSQAKDQAQVLYVLLALWVNNTSISFCCTTLLRVSQAIGQQ